MQPYRISKPHDDCERCTPGGSGHQLCQVGDCTEPAESQHRRYATRAEWEEIPEGLKPVDGVVHKAVFTCTSHKAKDRDVHRADCEAHVYCVCEENEPVVEHPRRTVEHEDPALKEEAMLAVHAAEMAFYKDILMQYGGDTTKAEQYVGTLFGGYLEQAKHVQDVRAHDAAEEA